MSDGDQRHVTLERVDTGVYRATNPRGVELTFGSLLEDGFTPVELLLAAIGGCSAVDVDLMTTRRADPERFEVEIDAEKVVDDRGGNLLRDLRVTFRVTFPDGADGDKARDRLPRAVRNSHDRTCTVSRTVEAGTPVTVRIDDGTG
ncbi:MAG: OsmC family peroxiredoxin [Nitriliruptor sp.]|nr:MAG: OsmC family peroxiredoxin [Nitriliruptor sp.]